MSICGIWAYSIKRRTVNNRRVQTRVHAVETASPNVPQMTETIPVQPAYIHSVEELPPSYEDATAYARRQR